MGIFEIVLIGVGLAMDAFAVSVCKGLSMFKMSFKKAVIIAVYFGFFQAIMPFIGYVLGSKFSSVIESFDHWIAFILLLLIGGNMIKESFVSDDENRNDSIDVKTMLVLSVATSIDALAVGVTLAFLQANIIVSVLIIGIVTFVLSLFGVIIGNKFGDKFENKAEYAGGMILILIGIKILAEHLEVLIF